MSFLERHLATSYRFRCAAIARATSEKIENHTPIHSERYAWSDPITSACAGTSGHFIACK